MYHVISNTLRSGDRLDVVGVQVLLEVEVRQLLALLQGQKAAQLGVRLDVMAVLDLQAVRLDVLADQLGHVGAALLAARGAAQERAQRGGDVGGDLEHAGLALARDLGRLAAALVGQLLDLRSLLLQALGLRDQLAHRLADGEQAGSQGLRLSLQADLLDLLRGRGGSRLRRRGRSGHRRSSGRRSSSSSLLLLGSGGLLGRRRSGRRSGRRHGGGDRGSSLLSLLGNALRGLGGGGSAHYTSGGGSRRGHFTQGLMAKGANPNQLLIGPCCASTAGNRAGIQCVWFYFER